MKSAPQDQAGTRTIAGIVTNTGATVSGTDFSVTKTGTGSYTVRWLRPIKAVLGVTATTAQILAAYAILSIPTPTEGFQVKLTTGTADVDGYFSFNATVIPR